MADTGEGSIADWVQEYKSLRRQSRKPRAPERPELPADERTRLDHKERRASGQYRGVFRRLAGSHRQARDLYIARIKICNKHTNLGSFTTAEDAALAYDKAARQHHGDGAKLNFPRRKRYPTIADTLMRKRVLRAAKAFVATHGRAFQLVDLAPVVGLGRNKLAAIVKDLRASGQWPWLPPRSRERERKRG